MVSTHRLKITIKNTKPPVWRRLDVPSEYTLAEFHDVLLTAMGWAGYHLYAIRIGELTYTEDDEDDWGDEAADPASVRLGDLVGPGDRFVDEYDFGDGWEHLVVVEDVTPAADSDRPRCLAGGGACPPEDVGGPGGYAEFLRAISDPEHEQHDQMLDWVGGQFDPAAFDPVEADKALAEGR